MPLRLKEVDADKISQDLIAFWRDCTLRNRALSPFHGPDWLLGWARAYGETASAHALVCVDSANRPVGLLPMMRTPGGLRSWSYNATDYTGFVWGDRLDGVAKVAELLEARADLGDDILLWNIRTGDPLAGRLSARNRLRLVSRTEITSVRLPLALARPSNQLEPMSISGLARKRRRLLRRGARIQLNGRLHEALLTEMFRVHTAGWEARGETGSFADSRRRQFLRELIGTPLKMVVATLTIENQLVSYRVGPTDSRTYFDWNTGTDPQFGPYSPGLVLLDEALQRLSVSERVDTVDFLRGSEDYKRAWATSAGWVSTFRVVPNGSGPGVP